MQHVNRFVGLDGLRGVAAFFVITRHLPDHTVREVFPASYLAVDVFFVISGFVLAHAYGQRFTSGLGVGEFMRLRLVRLYPLYLLSLLIGVMMMLWREGPVDAGQLASLIALGLLLLPAPRELSLSNGVYPFNYPAWSLFLELVINLVYVLIARRLNSLMLGGIVALGAALTIAASVAFNGLDVGSNHETFIGGFPRVIFSFFAGVALHRLWRAGRLKWLRAPTWLSMLILIGVFAVPAPIGPLRAAFDAFAVLIVFPVITFTAAQAQPMGGFARACAFAGAVSYAFYILQIPVIWTVELLFQHVLGRPITSMQELGSLLLVLTVVAAAWAADVYFDTPVRRWLAKQRR